MAPTPRPPRGRRLAVGAGLSALVLLPLVFWRRPLIATHHHCFRLAQCRTFEEAGGHLDEIHRHARHPGAAEAVVGMLGPRRQWLTCWLLQDLVQAVEPRERHGGFFPPALGPRLPIIREIQRRVEREEQFLDLGIHFLRWAGRGQLEGYLEELSSPTKRPVLEAFLGSSKAWARWVCSPRCATA